ncbi:hypothetical protein [Raoultibacter timonensis]|uniref:hypothetical protein n=1 Tax=Raoultibacter timonensis TaxID=1907662 RepID=UPI0026DCB233|nr:hypothetical protein [Raoultibacter timonensis]
MEADELASKIKEDVGAEYLCVKDLQELFRVGYSKARLMMNKLPYVRIGKRDAVLKSQLTAYVAEHGGITVEWPKRKR